MKKLSYCFVKKSIEKEKYRLISTTYKNSTTKLEILCKKEHMFRMDWRSFNSGARCSTCAGNIKPTYEFVKNKIEKEGYKLISTTYINANSKLEIICPKNHVSKKSWYKFNNENQRCSVCVGNKKYTYEFVKKSFEKEGYELISTTYVNANSKLDYLCPKGHESNICWYNFNKKKHRCNICLKDLSKNEKECREIFENIFNKKFPTVRPNFLKNPETGYNLELDGYNEELKLAFEYDGEQHYNKGSWGGLKSLTKNQKRDKLKDKLCKDYGIILIRIPYFIKNKEECIKEKIGGNFEC